MMNYTAANQDHAPRCFYKYMPACKAKVVLANRTLRWSSPERFNDPFDTHPDPIQFDHGELRQALLDEISADSRNDIVRRDPRLMSLLETPSNGLLDELKHFWRDILSNMRVLCLSEVIDLTAMWAHYANQATGVALQFKALDRPESPFRAAVPVVYRDSPPAITCSREWARLMIRFSDWYSESVNSFLEYEHTKTTEWKAEMKWRVSLMNGKEETKLYRDYPFDVREFTAVYFGWKCSDEDRAEIDSLLSCELDHVKTFNTYLDLKKRRYAFKEVYR